jgi:DNA-binding response OmpR family regulator
MKRRILMVDDELDFSELAQYRLADCGCQFTLVTNSTDALNSAWDSPPDLILLDLLLPDLDGLSVCEIFTRHPATLDIPIIMISAVGTDVTRYSAQVAGARDFFPKPVDFDKLKSAITTLLDNAPRKTENPKLNPSERCHPKPEV